jgi:translation elongation factor EF-1alpha
MTEGDYIGEVTHFYKKVMVGVVQLRADLKLGEQVRFKGAHTDFVQRVESMQIEHENIEQASAGSEVAMKVDQRVRGGDSVYRMVD